MYDLELYKKIIQKIKDYLGERYNENLFLSGGCFWFANYCVSHMQHVYLMFNKEQEHCAVEIQNQLYDITGRIAARNYVWATSQNVAYMKQHYIPAFDIKDLEEYLDEQILLLKSKEI